MRSVLDGFNAALSDLRRYLQWIDLSWALLRATDVDAPPSVAAILQSLRGHVGTGAAKRRLEYNSIVVTLYGIVEQFVEALIRAYASRLNRVVPRYAELPDAIRNSHIELSYSLLTKTEHRRFQGLVTAESLIANLHSCLNGTSRYTLNSDAFAHHTANFRAAVIESTLSRLGLMNLCGRLKAFPPFDSYLASQFPGRAVDSITAGEMYFYLDDLAQRRNDVSHGTPSELLSNELLNEYVDFVEVFGSALYEFVRTAALEYDVKHWCIDLGEPIVVHNHSIVCIKLRETPVKLSDMLIARTGDPLRPYIGGAIAEMQVNGNCHSEIAAQPEIDVGLRVEFKAKKSYHYYLLDAANA